MNVMMTISLLLIFILPSSAKSEGFQFKDVKNLKIVGETYDSCWKQVGKADINGAIGGGKRCWTIIRSYILI